jgi:hypothetical protein
MNKDPSLTLPAFLPELAGQHSLANFQPIPGGHTGALLYAYTNAEGAPQVVKLAVDEDGENEVRGNAHGYKAISEAGGQHLLAPGITMGTIGDKPYLLMPHLGENISEQARRGTFQYQPMLQNIEYAAQATLACDPGVQSKGLREFCDHLARFYSLLKETGHVSDKELAQIATLDTDQLSSDNSSLMLLDFTPDNLFTTPEGVAFIDPWIQNTYCGSFVPSLAQFATLSTEVYQLPNAEPQVFQDSIKVIGTALGLTPTQIQRQAALGEALQYGLSGYVRLDSDPELAIHFVNKSKQALARAAV